MEDIRSSSSLSGTSSRAPTNESLSTEKPTGAAAVHRGEDRRNFTSLFPQSHLSYHQWSPDFDDQEEDEGQDTMIYKLPRTFEPDSQRKVTHPSRLHSILTHSHSTSTHSHLTYQTTFFFDDFIPRSIPLSAFDEFIPRSILLSAFDEGTSIVVGARAQTAHTVGSLAQTAIIPQTDTPPTVY